MAQAISHLLDAEPPFRVGAWDGGVTQAPVGAPVLRVRSSRALRRLLWRPDRMGLVRAWVADDIDVEGDPIDLLQRLFDSAAQREPGARRGAQARAQLMRISVLLGAVGPEPAPPPAELPVDASLDVPAVDADDETDGADRSSGQEVERSATVALFFAERSEERVDELLGSPRIDSVGLWDPTVGQAPRVEQAVEGQVDADGAAKAAERYVNWVARSAHLSRGSTVLDVSPGWGGVSVALADRHGVSATCVAATNVQREAIERLAERRGVADRLQVLVPAQLHLEGQFDAVLSPSLAWGRTVIGEDPILAEYAGALRPGGSVVAQMVLGAGRELPDPRWFAEAYPVPRVSPARLGRVVLALEERGLVVLQCRSRGADLAVATRHWLDRVQRAAAGTGDDDVVRKGQERAWVLALAALGAQANRGRYHVVDVVAMLPHTGAGSAELLPVEAASIEPGHLARELVDDSDAPPRRPMRRPSLRRA